MRESENSRISRLEAKLANDVRSYLSDYKSSDRIEAERLRELCSTLARFFGELVRGHEKWNRFYWVDDFAPLLAKVEAGSEVALDGLLIRGQQKQSSEWTEPLLASPKIPAVGSPLEYEITCGDADQGLGTRRYGEEGLPTKRTPRDWLFTFTNRAS